MKDEVEHRKLIYGQISSSKKPTISIIRRTNKVGQLNDEVQNKLMQRKNDTHHKDLSNLKTAFSEYYLMLILLQKYQLLNFTGFIKILKKHDKLFHTTRGDEWRYVFS